MGIFFNDPDLDFEDFYWFNAMADEIFESRVYNEELISIDEELETHSCYVELHKKGINYTV